MRLTRFIFFLWGMLMASFVGWYLYQSFSSGWMGWTATLLCLFVALLVTWSFFSGYRHISRLQHAAQHHLFVCPDCEYPLHKLSDPGICPECGRPYSFRKIQAYWIDVETQGGEESKNPYRRQK